MSKLIEKIKSGEFGEKFAVWSIVIMIAYLVIRR